MSRAFGPCPSVARGTSPRATRRLSLVVAPVLFGLLLVILSGVACAPTSTASDPRTIQIVAAENFYGDLATQLGGDRVHVVSILKDPSVDPHEYESSVDDAKAVADARIVIKNGAGYDAFVDRLLAASPRSQRVVIDVSQLTGHRSGDNPHVWYDPPTMPKVAGRLTDELTRLDPADKDYFAQRLKAFNTSEQAVDERIATLKSRYAGTNVLPTEPVFDYMAEALGLTIVDRDGAFQKAVEEGNDPPASAVGAFRRQIASRTIKALIYNRQAVTPITTQMLDYARQNGVPIVAVSETEPTGKTYQQWMLDQLGELQKALEG
ncbi:MAG: metal ABC transporter solute-binding protein, Zn/Mn family [Chloroflexota bacterium]